MLTIASWNVNSLRVRLPHLTQWLGELKPDAVMLQETKTRDEDFPVAALGHAGYQCVYCGEKTYNGVAILSKAPVEAACLEFAGFPAFPARQQRIIAATLGDIRLINVYVPNGEAVGSAKYEYKLAWLSALRELVVQELTRFPKLIVAGDFNIAPDDRDVHDPAAWHERILCSTAERAALRNIMECGLQDSLRTITQESGLYSWWDYRAAGFRRNLGLRIDLLLVSSALAPQLRTSAIDKAPRAWERPSDHAPVYIEVNS